MTTRFTHVVHQNQIFSTASTMEFVAFTSKTGGAAV